MSQSRWHDCALCGVFTQYALCGNLLLDHRDVQRLPAECAPVVSWRCQDHQHYTMRAASAVRASELGDLIYTLTCGHEVQWVFRGKEAFTPTMLARGLTTRQIRLDQRQRCYRCSEQEQEQERSAIQ